MFCLTISQDGNTALMYAIYGDHKNCVQELLNHNADITIENSNLDTAYSIAVEQNLHTGKHSEIQN